MFPPILIILALRYVTTWSLVEKALEGWQLLIPPRFHLLSGILHATQCNRCVVLYMHYKCGHVMECSPRGRRHMRFLFKDKNRDHLKFIWARTVIAFHRSDVQRKVPKS